jgi:CRP/FNR family transcriptional regulator, cyclic AMP receptor protein
MAKVVFPTPPLPDETGMIRLIATLIESYRPMEASFFRKFTLFAELDDRELASIAAVAKSRRYAKDDVVFHADESGDIFCLIKEGQVKVTMISPEGKEIILSLLGPGDFFGEMALLDNEPRSATIIATEPLEIATIWRSDFLHILSENFSITQKVLAELSRRLRNASNRIESLATMDVYGRLARFFLDAARDRGKVLDNGYVAVTRPTHQSIANMIGTSRETVSRLIHDLMKQNLLLSEGKTIYLRKTALDQFRAET